MSLAEILVNPILLSCLAAVVISQLLKISIDYMTNRRWKPSILLSTGGMPSSHSAVVTALATSIYLAESVTSLLIVVIVIAIMTVYDSLTIRRAVGHHSSILNLILKALKLHKKYPVRELAGHSFSQVIMGIVLGIAVSLIVCWNYWI